MTPHRRTPCFAKTYDRIRKRFYWPGMYRNVVRYIAPFHRIGIDLLGRFPKSAHGNKWIIVCTDYSTRYAITKALPTAEVDEIAKFLLEEIVLRHGAPRVLRRLSAVTYEVQDFDPASRKRKLREVVHVLRMKPYHDPAEQIETEDIPPKESYKGPITRSRIKTLEQK
ncbi:transposon Ty3-I Gag-Pol polyprotein [Trichonephila clavipes]|nr:transposon Ty3-I Gag-Pol polyprotein [Trichonephila clavipes]